VLAAYNSSFSLDLNSPDSLVYNFQMPFKEEMERSGHKLFRRRSYLPLLAVPFIAAALLCAPARARSLEKLFDIWDGVCFLVSCMGLLIRAVAVGYAPKGTSGRNTKGQKAEQLNVAGMYSLVRHPIYLGNFIVWLGMVMFSRSPWCVLAMVLLFWVYYERIMFAEEEFLRGKFGETYTAWAERTPLFIPRLSGFKPPLNSFSIKSVLTREYTTISVTWLYFIIFDSLDDFINDKVLGCDMFWQILLVFTVIFYLTIRLLKKKTKLLATTDR
jgi:protein-S-isoprenylcysteine O-methyltransferase Ste14